MNKMKSLLIYNSNIANKTREDYNVADIISYYCNMANIHSCDYAIDFSSIDSTLKDLETTKFDIIYIKDSLTINCLDFIGMELAYHIRFTQKFKYVPIVILSDLDGFTLSKLTTKAQILLTKNTFLNQAPKTFPLFDESNYKEKFLDQISVEQPKDTSGSHDIANIWSIYRWSKFLKVESAAITTNNEKIFSSLYFKYLIALNPMEKTKGITFAPKSPVANGKILYIDDQWNEGWKDIFDKYFSKSSNIEFNTFEYIYKDKDKETVLKDIESKVIDYNPDMVILDLRLSEKDHDNIDIDSFTGIKILNIIKEINPGIQVVMVTATSQSIILERLYKYGILGYIKKEHPIDKSIKTKDNFLKLKDLIDDGLENKYLKDIWDIQREIQEIEIFIDDKYNEIRLEIESVFEILNTQMDNRFIYSMFAIFKSLEILVKFYIKERKEDKKRFAYWKSNNTKIPYINEENCLVQVGSGNFNDTTENKIRVLLHQKLNLKDRIIHNDIHRLVTIRNATIHPHRENHQVKVIKDDILCWFNILKIIIKNIK